MLSTRMPFAMLFLVTSVWTLAPGTEMARPNVLFIAVDDLNDWPACLHVYPDAKTPNIDSLAARGTLFSRAYCQYPICGPSRASVMTGLLPTTLAFDYGGSSFQRGDNKERQPRNRNNMSSSNDSSVQQRASELGTQLLYRWFADHGYQTMAVGKILHRHVPAGSVDLSGGRGSFGSRQHFVWHQIGTLTDWGAHPEHDEDLPDFDAAQWACERLSEDHEKPFLLMVGFLRPHVPWYVPQKWFELYPRKKQLTLPPYNEDDLFDVPRFGVKTNWTPEMPSTRWAIENNRWRDIVQAYLACISFTDHYIGEVLAALANSKYADNTIVVLWSDHGYHLGEKGQFSKHTLWERAAHVPLIFAGPGVPRNQKCHRTVGLIDIYPTLLQLCDLPANEMNEGRSLVPLLEDPTAVWDFPVVTTYAGNNHAVQTEQYRYIRYEDGSEELYDHRVDPHEWTNLAGDSSYDNLRQRLATHLPTR